MLGWAIAAIFIAQTEANTPSSQPPVSLQPKSLETKTPIGRVGLGVDGDLDTKGQKDVAIGYVYSIRISDDLKSTFDLQPFFVQRIDIDDQTVKTDAAQGAGLMLRFKPGEQDQTSWYARLKYLVDDSTSSLNNGRSREDWQLSFGVEIPLDSQSKQRRRLKALKRLEPKPMFTINLPPRFFEASHLSREDQMVLHSLILVNYIVRLAEYLATPLLERKPLQNETNLVDIRQFPSPNILIEMAIARSHAEHPESEERPKELKRQIAELLNKYSLILRSDSQNEMRFVSIYPTGYLFERDRGKFLDPDQMVEDFVELLNSTKVDMATSAPQTFPITAAR